MYTRFTTTLLAIFSVVCAYQIGYSPSVAVSQTQIYKISSIETNLGSDSLDMTIRGDSPPAYTVSERFDPYRLIVDIADTELDSAIDPQKILADNDVARLNLSMLKDQDPPVARFEFTIGNNATYDVQQIENDLTINIIGQPGETVAAAPAAAASTAAEPAKAELDESMFESPQQGGVGIKAPQAQKDDEFAQLQDSFSFSGYKGERISVDFYKIDLHNVFRLFREISGMNIIVDQAVKGTLTLALNDVPWEFALDIIMNLTGLQKEERYNTLVIYPKNKQFEWPEQAEDNLSFEADIEVVKEEALIIQESASQPAEIMQAKELLRQAYALEKENSFEEASALYEEAFKLWPDNIRISNKLANLYLGRLLLNAKAAYFAKKSLAIDPSDTKAALYCAISSANMEKTAEALECFAQSISGDPPMKEALISYAAFTENNNRLDASLKLLDTYGTYYGDNVQTMVSKARIYDKLGDRAKAKEQYRALLASGYQIRPDLKQYAESRATAEN
ncbi:MAG: AMIN domain-containing protein [Desulfofustis sp.]|nr:AMIN domain-containing protein [Desulfofustis sp.]